MAGQLSLQLNAPNIDAPVTIADVAAAVDGFKKFAYPYAGPAPCP